MGIQESFNEYLRVELRKLAEKIDDEIMKDKEHIPSKLPSVFIPEKVAELIFSEYVSARTLAQAFSWDDTPQGQKYWKYFHDRAQGSSEVKLSNSDRVYLQHLQKIHSKKNVPTKLPDRYLRGHVNDLLTQEYPAASDLWKAFSWADTPQEDGYWARLHAQLNRDKEMKLPEDARQYLLGLQKLDDEQGWQESIDIKAQDGSVVGTCTITSPASICLAEHLKQKGDGYLQQLLADVNYVYGDAIMKLCGDNLRLDVDEVTSNLKGSMVRLRERLRDEVAAWFRGNGLLLETGPEIVECYLSCKDHVWRISERNSLTRRMGVSEDICSRIAYHVMLASDVLTLQQEQKVMCLINLLLGT